MFESRKQALPPELNPTENANLYAQNAQKGDQSEELTDMIVHPHSHQDYIVPEERERVPKRLGTPACFTYAWMECPISK